MTRTLLAATLMLALTQTSAQRFRSGVDVVTVDALVTQNGRALTGLAANDFELRDNGVVQEIDGVSVDDAPVSMLLALDTSNSVQGPTLDHLKRAAIGAIDALTPADRAAATPWSVHTVPSPRGGFAELAKSSPLPAARAEAQLKLMNGVYGGGPEPKPGQTVKVVNSGL